MRGAGVMVEEIDVQGTIKTKSGSVRITDSKIFFISARSGHKEVWGMDYDGANQHQITRLGSISLSPRRPMASIQG